MSKKNGFPPENPQLMRLIIIIAQRSIRTLTTEYNKSPAKTYNKKKQKRRKMNINTVPRSKETKSAIGFSYVLPKTKKSSTRCFVRLNDGKIVISHKYSFEKAWNTMRTQQRESFPFKGYVYCKITGDYDSRSRWDCLDGGIV